MKRIILLLTVLIILSTSCKKDFLQRDPGAPISEENVFNDPLLANRFADNSYNYLIDDYGRLSLAQGYKGMTGQFSDESIGSAAPDFLQYMTVMNQGLFLDPLATDVIGIYTRMYQGIRNVNIMLDKIDAVPWSAIDNPKLVRAQMLYLRAFFYYELLKRFDGVVLLDKALKSNESLDLPRSTHEETVAFIFQDLTDAELILSTETFGDVYTPAGGWNTANYGRPTVGALKALRSRLLLLDASPLHNPSQDAAKWKKAADASKEIIDLGKYALHNDYKTLLNQGGVTNSEYILIKVRGPRGFGGFINDFVVPPSSGGAQGLLNPTQNHVDLYEMSNGLPITDPASGYNPQDPYKGRDPRFYANIIYNDLTWQGRKIQMFEGGIDYQPGSNSFTRTRYYCRKLWPEVYRGGSTATSLLNFIFFRYGEVLLNYAEALNEAEGSVADVYTYMNQIRKRAGMPDLPAGLTKEQMRKRIHNERAVELAFEEHRWWDILRWKEGTEIIPKTINAMDVVKTATGFTYNVIPMAAIYQRVFQDYMHIYPIPRNEVDKSNGILKQNPGW